MTEIDQIGLNETKVDLIGPNGIEVDLIGPNSNCLIFTEKKISSTNFREQIIHYITIAK